MDSRTSYVLKHMEHNGYLNKMADSIVNNLFKAIWFKTREEAEGWMQGIYAPEDAENYAIVEAITFISEVEEDV